MNDENTTALYVACLKGYDSCISLLLAVQAATGASAPHHSATDGDARVNNLKNSTSVVCSTGSANINYCCGDTGITSLFIAWS